MEQDVKVFQLELYLKPRISDPAVITVNAEKDMKRIIAGAYGIKKSKRQRRSWRKILQSDLICCDRSLAGMISSASETL
jgi:hypothetical protein